MKKSAKPKGKETKPKGKESYRLGEQVLEDKLALESTMDDAHEGELEDREETLEAEVGSTRGWTKELQEYEQLAKAKEKVDAAKAKLLKKKK